MTSRTTSDADMHFLNLQITKDETTMRYLVWTILFLATLTGCGPKTVKLAGQVTYDGQPAKDISVVFEPVSGGVAALGKTADDGKYTLRLLNDTKKTGIIPGDYKVFLRWVDPNQDPRSNVPTNANPYPKSLTVYSKEGIAIDVNGQTPNLNFELTREHKND